ncbi:MAG: formyltetrahydrofolate deformylase [Anaerolineae bacterium]|nr:formyltetrahydrofolate deformylase [Anaerolineae bacterium]
MSTTQNHHNHATATLLIDCPDRKGLVAGIANFLYSHNANILHADQHQDASLNLFLMRVEWDLEGFDLNDEQFREAFAPIAGQFNMRWRVQYSAAKTQVAIFVSKYDHCLVDLLYRYRSGEFNCEIPLVVSNHPDAREIVEFYGIPFHVIPVTAETKQTAEQQQIDLLQAHNVDLVVLARYMQVLSPTFVSAYAGKVINVHHSFLPAFIGAKPYHRAYDRGVKLIGATSHYVTEVLDEGPIIEQDVIRVSHRDSLEDFIATGRDLEKTVLSRAVRWHCDHRILVYGNKTAIFVS